MEYQEIIEEVLNDNVEAILPDFHYVDKEVIKGFAQKVYDEFHKTYNMLNDMYDTLYQESKIPVGEAAQPLHRLSVAINEVDPKYRAFLWKINTYKNDPKMVKRYMTKELRDAIDNRDKNSKFDKMHWIIGGIKMNPVFERKIA
jgi:ABC-type phosphate/phosphonate transport system substrate-binding protein